jgi:hypothetical protein
MQKRILHYSHIIAIFAFMDNNILAALWVLLLRLLNKSRFLFAEADEFFMKHPYRLPEGQVGQANRTDTCNEGPYVELIAVLMELAWVEIAPDPFLRINKQSKTKIHYTFHK